MMDKEISKRMERFAAQSARRRQQNKRAILGIVFGLVAFCTLGVGFASGLVSDDLAVSRGAALAAVLIMGTAFWFLPDDIMFLPGPFKAYLTFMSIVGMFVVFNSDDRFLRGIAAGGVAMYVSGLLCLLAFRALYGGRQRA